MLKPIILICAMSGSPCSPAEKIDPVFSMEGVLAATPNQCWQASALVLAQHADMLGGRPYRVRCEHVGD